MLRAEELPLHVQKRLRLPVAKAMPKADEMNGLEASYARYLDGLKAGGQILWYNFHGVGLRLADRTFFYPDFLVIAQDGFLEVHETKGRMMDDAHVKLKVAAAIYPLRFKLVRKVRGGYFQVEDV